VRSLKSSAFVLAQICLILLLVAVLCACGAAQSGTKQADGARHTVAGTRVSIEVPKGYLIGEGMNWGTDTPQGGILLTVRRQAEPAEGMKAYADQYIKQTQKSGLADIEYDKTVPLGDLEGRLIQAIELNRDHPAAIWLMLALAEDGLYAAAASGPAAALLVRRQELETFLKSLRIAAPTDPKAAPKKDPFAEVDLPQAVTP